MISEKNVAESLPASEAGFYEETPISDGFFILKFNNETDDNQTFKRETGSNFIQFHFCIKGSASFLFNEGNYSF